MKIRILISSTENRELYIAVTERLMRATREHPENWETVIGVPGVIDHVGHKTDTFSRVVWSREYDGGPLFRLTIRDDHPVYDDLRALIAAEITEQAPRETAEQITQRVLELESLGTWEERIKAAVYLARDRKFHVTEREGGVIQIAPGDGAAAYESLVRDANRHLPPETIAERVLDNHRIRPDWRRTGEQIIPLLAEAVRIARGEES